MNPYTGQDFFGFFSTLFLRLLGKIPSEGLYSDELQALLLCAIGISSSLLGSFLILRKMTMLANALSHTILVGIILAFLATASVSMTSINLSTMLLAALFTGLLTTVLVESLARFTNLQEDASIGLVFTTLFALGVMIATVYTRNAHIGTEAIMGNIDALHPEDLKIGISILGLNLGVLFLCFVPLKISSFDLSFAKTVGIPTRLIGYVLMVLTAATSIAAFRAIGVILFLGLIVIPVCTARQWTHRLYSLIGLAGALAIFSSLVGVALSRHFLSVYQIPLSTGSLVVTVMSLFYLLSTSVVLTLRRRPCLILEDKR